MRLVHCVVLGFLVLSACGEDDTAPPEMQMQMLQGSDMRPESTREGPVGCYIEAQRRCDCEIEEADCTQEGQIWTEGCASCQP
jgi:hypothetical protein